LSEGRWALNLSGNCPSCHHHHKSVQVHVHVSDDSTEVGDVRCHKCKRLWLAFGKGNARRLSLLSTKSMDPDSLETETEFHRALVRIIEAANSIAALSPTLTAIPEVASAGPSRKTSVRSTTHSYAQRRLSGIVNDQKSVSTNTSAGNRASGINRIIRPTSEKHTKAGKLTISKGWQALLRIKQKLAAALRTSQARPQEPLIPSGNRPNQDHHSQIRTSLSTGVAPIIELSQYPEEDVELRLEFDGEANQAALDVCNSSTTATGALATLEALDVQAIKDLPPHKRFEWGRRQITEFRARYAGSTTPAAIPVMVNNGTQASSSEDLLVLNRPLVRRHSDLAYVGNTFGTYEYWDAFRGSTCTVNVRPLSMSETNFSDADTAVDRTSVATTPQQLFLESLQRDHRGSRSPRPLSLHSIVSDWQQIRRNRAEARLSIDSAATGNAVRSITTARGRANNRLSRTSVNRTSSAYGTDPQTSPVQLRVDKDTENAEASASVGSPPALPPMSENDVSRQT
jgi:hypothetical protein